MRDEGCHIGGDKILALAQSHDERGIATRCDNDIYIVCHNRDESEGTIQSAAGSAHGF